MRHQRGVSLSGLLMVSVVIGIVALLGLKVTPDIIEYFKIREAIDRIAGDNSLRNASVGDVRKAFDRYANIDQIDVIQGTDLDITKDGNQLVVSFAYVRQIPLFSKVSLLIEFEGTSAKR